MNKNTKCFIKVGKGLFEEITLRELENRKSNLDTYKRRFIPIQRNAFRSV